MTLFYKPKVIHKKRTIKLPTLNLINLTDWFPATEEEIGYLITLSWIYFNRCYECGKITGIGVKKKGFIKKCITIYENKYELG